MDLELAQPDLKTYSQDEAFKASLKWSAISQKSTLITHPYS